MSPHRVQQLRDKCKKRPNARPEKRLKKPSDKPRQKLRDKHAKRPTAKPRKRLRKLSDKPRRR